MSNQQLEDIALAYYEALDTAPALTCAILLRYQEWDQLVNLTTDPSAYIDPFTYHKDVCARDFLRKLDTAPTSFDREKISLEKWYKAEQQCFLTNRKIWNILDGQTPSTDALEFFSLVRKNIYSLIGRPPEDLEFRFGPGVTYKHRGSRSLIPDKIASIPEMTVDAWVFINDWKQTAWARAQAGMLYHDSPRFSLAFPVVRGNRWASVPKDGRTNRAIAIEPTLNSFVQLGLGNAMRKRLNRRGLLLNNSQEIHRRLACKGSIDDSISTIDLSNASDTVAYALVKAVLPDEWFHLLNSSRSPHTQLPCGSWVRLEKFSSMGNGYTFELETTIFAAICMAVAEGLGVPLKPGINFSVFGDDIIVPATIASQVIAALKYSGFKLNHEKTFTSGPFRESCGGDFFNGVSVRGIFVKEVPSSPADWFVLNNKLCRVDDLADFTITKHLVKNEIPSSLRHLGGPSYLGDIVLHDVPCVSKYKHQIRYCKSLHTQTASFPLDRWGQMTAVASLLYGQSSDKVTPRNSITGYRVAWVAIP